MSSRTNVLLVLLLAGLIGIGSAYAQSPTMISFQGKLDSAGVPLNGPRTIVFAVYDDSLAGVKLWEETQSAVQVSNGLFHVMLGGVTALPPAVFLTPGVRFLAMRVGALDLAPRLRFASVPFALRSGRADLVADSAVTTAMIARGAVTPEKLSFTPLARPLSPGVATSEIADAAVTGAKIADGTITGVDIAAATIGTDKLSFTPVARPLSPGVATGEIADGAVTSAKIADGTIAAADLGAGVVASGNIANDAVTSAKIADGTIAGVDIAAATIGTDKLNFTPVARPLAPGVATVEIADGAVTSAKIADGGVATADIANSAITTGKIADGTITTGDIATDAVTPALTSAEAGVAQATLGAGGTQSLTSSPQSFYAVTVSAPAAGYVLVTAHFGAFVNHAVGGLDNVIIQIATAPGSISTSRHPLSVVRVPPNAAPTSAPYICYVVPVTQSFIFSVAAGNTTFHLNAYESSGTGDDYIYSPVMTAIYFPSAYGAVPAPAGATVAPDAATMNATLGR